MNKLITKITILVFALSMLGTISSYAQSTLDSVFINKTALEIAKEQNNAEVIKYLESKGINVNKKDKTALEIAKEQNNAEVIKYLESKGIDVNKKDKTAYDVAKEQVVIEYLKYLRGITNNFEEAKEILKMLESVNDSIKK